MATRDPAFQLDRSFRLILQEFGLSEGNIFAGEFLAPQMYLFRPAPGWNQYRTPIAGYYQCGSGTHPGGCVMGAPGKLAAGQINPGDFHAGNIQDPDLIEKFATPGI